MIGQRGLNFRTGQPQAAKMGGTAKSPAGSMWPPSHPAYGHARYHIHSVPAQKNITKATYQTPVHPQFQPSFKHPVYPPAHSGIRNFPIRGSLPGYSFSPESQGYTILQASHGQVWHEPVNATYPHFDGSPSSAVLATSPPKPSLDFMGSSQRFNISSNYGSAQNGFSQETLSHCGFPIARVSFPLHVFSTAHLFPPPALYPPMIDAQHVPPYIMVHDPVYDTKGGMFPSDPLINYGSLPNGYHCEGVEKAYSQGASSQMTNKHATVHDICHQRASEGYSLAHRRKLLLDKADPKLAPIKEAAYSFVDSYCPYLGEKPYCVPPVKRSRHPDKSIKQLVVGMESEKRVLGSFERFFAELQVPAFLLCHYPVSGFMQVYNCETSHDRYPKSTSRKNDRGNLTLLLLSDTFAVTVVTISIISSNSDFAYIQRGVHKALAHMKRCSTAVSQWLAFLGVMSDVKQVMAFPNLKRTVMHRIFKDKSYGSLCTLHVDDLSAPFEEEWSTSEHKMMFKKWMQENIMCHASLLAREELHLVVGALLSPRLSRVDFMKGMDHISPLSFTPPSYRNESEDIVKDVSQLTLTVDGVKKPFDEFIDEYVSAYYPNVEEQTYRVPPIHFNIQSFKKPAEYLYPSKTPSGKSSLVNGDSRCITTRDSSHLQENGFNEFVNCGCSGKLNDTVNDFMPNVYPNGMACKKGSQCCCHVDYENVGTVGSENNTDDMLCWKQIHTGDMAHKKCEVSEVKTKPETKDHSFLKSSPASNSPILDSLSQQPSSSRGSLTSHSPSPVPESSRKHLDELQWRLQVDAQLEALQDVEILSEVMTKDVRADEGENRVISALEKLGHKFGPMFIICDYQYNNYLNKLREEMFPKGEAKRPVRAFGQTMRAEHDCLIFHKKYGAIVVCIKAIGDNFTDWGASEEQKLVSTNKILEKAVKQLEREEAMIRHVTSDLHPKLACHKLIALPNLTRESVIRALEKDSELLKKIKEKLGHGVELFLCSDELPSKFQSCYCDQGQSSWNKLVHWWEQVQQQIMEGDSGLSTRVYRQVIGRYCGLLSTVEVWSSTIPRVEVRSLSEAAHVCAQRYNKMVLLPRQLQALCANHRRMFLCGPPGSGKTLLLTLKARKWLLEGETVVIVNSRVGSSLGYPCAYGVLNQLQQMMAQAKVQAYKLFMIGVNPLQFRCNDLAGVMPSCCIIMDEITPASHEILEHLCCLQVKNIWCAGLFQDDKPITAHSFATHNLDKIIRCPPVIQSIMKLTEHQIRMSTPYKDVHETFGLVQQRYSDVDRVNILLCDYDNQHSIKERQQCFSICDLDKKNDYTLALQKKTNEPAAMKVVQKDKVVLSSSVHTPDAGYKEEMLSNQTVTQTEINTVDLEYDPDSLNKRLMEKYGKQPQKTEESKIMSPRVEFNSLCYSTSSAATGLPTDGLRPLIIDHSGHSKPGGPKDCYECGQKLAEFLNGMVRPEGMSSPQRRQGLGKNKHAFKNNNMGGIKIQTGQSNNGTPSPIISPVHTHPVSNNGTPSPIISPVHTHPVNGLGKKTGVVFDSRALSWSDVIIAAKEMSNSCSFVSALSNKHIPVEVVMSGHTSVIEDFKENKLFITSYKEVTGLERAVVVFVPSQGPDNAQQTYVTSEDLDLHMGHSINRYSEEDKRFLWHVASRSLACLVLILP